MEIERLPLGQSLASSSRYTEMERYAARIAFRTPDLQFTKPIACKQGLPEGIEKGKIC
jgi:hypothetical protein